MLRCAAVVGRPPRGDHPRYDLGATEGPRFERKVVVDRLRMRSKHLRGELRSRPCEVIRIIQFEEPQDGWQSPAVALLIGQCTLVGGSFGANQVMQ